MFFCPLQSKGSDLGSEERAFFSQSFGDSIVIERPLDGSDGTMKIGPPTEIFVENFGFEAYDTNQMSPLTIGQRFKTTFTRN